MAKVLVAEDEPEMRKLLVSALKEAGYETRETFDGLGALYDIKEFQPNLLILDWMLPELSGNEVLNALREGAEFADYRHLKVIVVSDFHSEESRRTFFHAGADDFIAKTEDVDALKANLLTAARLQLEGPD